MSIINLPDNIIEQALFYYDKGLLVLPARPDSKAPALPWKEFKTRKPSREETVKLFEKAIAINGEINIGALLGPMSGIAVFDFDSDSSIKWGVEQGLFGIGPTVITGSGKRHVYVRYEDCLNNLTGCPVPGFELRANGLFIMLPPSIHPETKQPYRWADGMSLDEIDLPEAPSIIKDECRKKSTDNKKRRSTIIEETANGVGKGKRHITVVSIAAKLFHLGSGKEEVLAYALEWNKKTIPLQRMTT